MGMVTSLVHSWLRHPDQSPAQMADRFQRLLACRRHRRVIVEPGSATCWLQTSADAVKSRDPATSGRRPGGWR